MLKNYFFKTWLLALLLPVALVVHSQTSDLGWSESFENGIPSDWTQESIVGNLKWTVESGDGLQYPEGIADGKNRVAFRNPSGITTRSVTRLVTPYFDPSDIQTPVLVMSYATPRWGQEFDTLRVFYRAETDGRWSLLHEFDSYSNVWTSATVELVAWTSTYQLAFEAVDNNGRGIVIDNIAVRPKPDCTTPNTLEVKTVGETTATLSWFAGFSQEAFQVRVSTKQLKDFELAEETVASCIVDTVLEGDITELELSGLEKGSLYYFYVRTLCGQDATSWTPGPEIKTLNQIAVPLTQDFNLEPTEDSPSYVDLWYHFNSLQDFAPFVNTTEETWNLSKYSYDNSYALIFSARNRYGTPQAMPANSYAYIATPELIVDDISLLQVSFQGKSDSRCEHSKIIVGIMSNPKDISTFVEVQTVTLPVNDENFAVSFAGYEGKGKHIALMSRFAEENMAYIDNLKVDFAPDCPRILGVKAVYPDSKSMVVTYDGFAAKADIFVATEPVEESQLSSSDKVIARKTNVDNNCLIDGLTPWTRYYVYVRSNCGENVGAWCSSVLAAKTPDAFTAEPYEAEHTIQAGKYLVLPELSVADLRTLSVSFTANAPVTVGIMDTVGSDDSFYQIERVNVSGKTRCNVSLSTYPSDFDGKFIAFEGMSSDIVVEKTPTCIIPSEVVIEPSDLTAKVSWNGNGAAKWQIRVSSGDKFASLDDAETEWIYTNDDLTATTVDIPGLVPGGESDYYVYLRAVCGEETTAWTFGDRFRTICARVNELPYKLDFEGTDPFKCVLTKNRLSTSTWKKYEGSKSMNMQPTINEGDMIMAFNDMDIDKISDLKITMMMQNYHGYGDVGEKLKCGVDIGTMSDWEDKTTFDSLTTAYVTEMNEWQEVVVPLNGYTGNNKTIAIRCKFWSTSLQYQIFIDSLVIEKNTGCVKVNNPFVKNVTHESATLAWRVSTDKKWDAVLSDKKLSASDLDKVISGIEVPGAVCQAKKDITKAECEFTGLTAEKTYYFVARAICDDATVGAWSNALPVVTGCSPIDPESFGVETFEQYADKETPGCWKMLQTGTSYSATNKFVPSIRHEASAPGGVSSLKIATVAEGSDAVPSAYIFTPAVGVEDITKVRMTFWGASGIVDYNKLTNYSETLQAKPPYQKQLKIGIANNPEDLSTIREVAVIDGFTTGQYYTVSFDQYEETDWGQGKYVVFYSEFAKNNTFYIDNVSFRLTEECDAPVALTAEDLTFQSAKLTWRELGSSAPYTLKVADRELSTEELSSDVELKGVASYTGIQTTEYELNGLDYATDYYCYVGSSCGGGMVWSGLLHFVTDCRPEGAVLPYIENFDRIKEVGEGMMPACWMSVYKDQAKPLQYPHVSAHEAVHGNCLYVYYYQQKPYALLPKMYGKVSDLTISMDVIGDNTTVQRSLVVGYVSDIKDDESIISTFIPVDTILVIGYEVKRYTVDLKGAIQDAERIVLTADRSLNGDETKGGTVLGRVGGVYVDNIVVESTAQCKMPESISVTDVTAASFTVAATGNCELVYSNKGFNPYDEESTVEPVAFTDTKTVNALAANTEYDVYVRSVCSETDKGAWVGPYSVRTVGEPLVVDGTYSEDFENVGSEWMLVNDGQCNYWMAGSALHNGETSAKALYVTDNGTDAAYNEKVASKSWALRTINLKSGMYQFSYDWLCSGETDFDFMRVGLMPVTSFVEAGYVDAGMGEGFISLEKAGKPLADATETAVWHSDTVNLIVTAELAGMYNIVVYWQNNNEVAVSAAPSAAIDNFAIEYTPCVEPLDIKVDKISYDGFNAAWDVVRVPGFSHSGFELMLVTPFVEHPDNIVEGEHTTLTKEITEPETLSALWKDDANIDGNTEYALFVRTICGENYSEWAAPVRFTTLCDPQEAGIVYDFETNIVSAPVSHPDCWVVGHNNPLVPTSSWLQVRTNNSSYMGAHNGRAAISTSSNPISREHAGGYMAMPVVADDLDGKQLSFWMRPLIECTDWNDDEGGTYFYQVQDYLDTTKYARAITVGVMDDPNDFSTFRKIRDYVYPYTSTDITAEVKPQDDINGNNYWYKVILPLENLNCTGKYLVFLNDDYGKARNIINIDDVVIEDFTGCIAPEAPVIGKITSTTADMEIKHSYGEEFEILLSDNPRMNNVIQEFRVKNQDNVKLENLNPATNYYVCVRMVCGTGEDDHSDYSMVTSFKTSYGLRYHEQFGADRKIAPVDYMITRPLGNNLSDLYTIPAKLEDYRRDPESYDMGWGHAPVSEYYSAHNYVIVDYVVSYNLLITPNIYVREGEKASLSFDLAVTNVVEPQDGGEKEPGYEDLLNTDLAHGENTFVVMVSEDNGVTWSKDNTFTWGNVEERGYDFKFSELSKDFRTYSIDLTRFMDKNIRIAFGASHNGGVMSTLEYTARIDNIIVNTLEKVDIDKNICTERDYVEYGFNVDFETIAEEAKNKVYTAQRYGYSVTEDPDTLYNLQLHIVETADSVMKVQICEGRTFTGEGFNASETGIYKKKMLNATGDKCDSVLVLDLTVVPSKTHTITETICGGGEFELNGEKYTETGKYQQILTSVEIGCDSVVIIDLTVEDVKTYTVDTAVCFGSVFQFGDEELTESDTYKHVFKTEEGCDSAVTLNLTVLPEYIDLKNVVMCDGETYNDEVFQNIKRDYEGTVTVKSKKYGCDSIVGRDIVFIKEGEVKNVERTISLEDLPYEYHGKVFDTSYKEGTYQADIDVKSQSGDCAGTIHLTLNIGEKTAVDNLYGDKRVMTIEPNPVKVGDMITIGLDLTEAEREDAVVNVYNAAGSLVKSFAPAKNGPIVMHCYFVPGVYVVRLIDGTGNVYYGKVIIE